MIYCYHQGCHTATDSKKSEETVMKKLRNAVKNLFFYPCFCILYLQLLWEESEEAE